MEFQMRNKTFISSMVGVAAAVAVAGSANASIINGNGQGSNCASLDPSTDTTITYTTGSWAGTTTARSFYMGFGVANQSYGGYVAGLQITNIEYSTDSGASWILGASSYTTGTTTLAGFSSADSAPASAPAGTWAFNFTSGSGIVGNALRVRATLSATSSIPNQYNFYAYSVGKSVTNTTVFSGANLSTVLVTVPAPGAFALLGVAGLVGGRRRRD
jgi:MYXO-CTERM domain-containing protein